jgi:hypothetical protein
MESSIERLSRSPESRVSLGIPAAIGAGLAALLAAWGTYGSGEEYSNGEYLAVLAIIAVATAGVFGWLVPRALRGKRGGATALVLSALGFLAVAVFWAGLPPVFAVGGIVVGLAGWDAPRGAWLNRAAVVLGAVAIAADIAVYIADTAF